LGRRTARFWLAEISPEISLFIRPPRSNGAYRDRDLDCQDAIEPDFLLEVRSAGTPYVDLARVKVEIAAHALPLGWTSDELEAAMQELIRCYMLRVQPAIVPARSAAPGSR
jgi:hypothetical protein